MGPFPPSRAPSLALVRIGVVLVLAGVAGGFPVHGQQQGEQEEAQRLLERSQDLEGTISEPERLEILLQAEQAITPLTDRFVQWRIHRSLGDLLARYHADDLVLGQRREELRVFRQLGFQDHVRLSITLRSYASALQAMGRMDSALVYLKEALHVVPDSDPRYRAGGYNSLALLYMSVDSLALATTYLDSAEAALGDRAPEVVDVRFSIRDNRADIALALGRTSFASELVAENLRILKDAFHVDPDVQDRYERYSVKLAHLWLDAGQLDRARVVIDDLRAALPRLREDFRQRARMHLPVVEHRLQQLAGNVHAEARLAAVLLLQADSLAEQVARDRARSTGTITRFAVEQVQRKLAARMALEEERTLSAEARARARTTIAALITVSALITIIGIVLLFRSRIRRRLAEKQLVEQELAFRQKDLQGMAMDLGRKQQWTRQLLDATYAIEEAPAKEVPERIKQLETKVQAELRIDEQREWITRNIDQVNTAFYERLLAAHPHLARTEVELCGLIRAGLTNAAVADLRHISIASARTARYRLKAKLGIGKDEDLVEVLKEL